jgi:peptidoglycan/xylan/chitin deacetylase (PgdA/CDA1 family)
LRVRIRLRVAIALAIALVLALSNPSYARVLRTTQSAATPAHRLAAIFMYHHVSATVSPGPYARVLTVQPAEFARQLSWLRTHGCETVTVDTIVDDVAANALRGCEVAITFDDGYADQAVVARPALDAAGDTATLYVSSGLVGAAGHVTIPQLLTLADDGLQIGAHTINHVDLTTLDESAGQHEIAGSRAALRRWTHAAVDSFAYPAGARDARVETLVRAAGFRNALTTQPGALTTDEVTADPYALPRYRVERDTGSDLIARVVGPASRVGRTPNELRAIARERAEGNDPALAERIGAALLNASFPEQLLKVRVLRVGDATVVGIMLSGVKFHAALTRREFAADVGGMIDRAFDARPDVGEVDVWAVTPLEVQPTGTVSGDYAAPTTRTVFSAAVMRAQRESAASRTQMLGTMYWGERFLNERAR